MQNLHFFWGLLIGTLGFYLFSLLKIKVTLIYKESQSKQVARTIEGLIQDVLILRSKKVTSKMLQQGKKNHRASVLAEFKGQTPQESVYYYSRGRCIHDLYMSCCIMEEEENQFERNVYSLRGIIWIDAVISLLALMEDTEKNAEGLALANNLRTVSVVPLTQCEKDPLIKSDSHD